MPYIVNFTDRENKTPITVFDNTSNADTSLDFPGRNVTGYGQIIAENFLVLPGIARDLSAIVSGVIGIVKQKGGEVKEGPDESFIAEKDFQAAKKLKKPTQIVEETKKKKDGIGASIGGGIGSLYDNFTSVPHIQSIIIGITSFFSTIFGSPISSALIILKTTNLSYESLPMLIAASLVSHYTFKYITKKI